MTKITINKSEFKKLYDVACSDWKKKFDEFLKEFIFTDTIDFSEDFINKMKNACTSDQLPIFNSIFKDFLPKSIFDGIKDYKSFCKVAGVYEWTLEEFNDSTNPIKLFAQEQISQIEAYFGKNWKKDWKNKNQCKYYPYFKVDNNGVIAFHGCSYHCDGFSCGVAYFETEEITTFVGKTFTSIYQNLL